MGSTSGKLNLPPGIGRAGEAAAKSFVTDELGYDIAQTNFRVREGEIDIIAIDGEVFVFIEVKTRSNKKFGTGVEQISRGKANRLQIAAQSYLQERGKESADWRIDMLSVDMARSGSVRSIEHIPNAIEG